jgi:hypothetical protein
MNIGIDDKITQMVERMMKKIEINKSELWIECDNPQSHFACGAPGAPDWENFLYVDIDILSKFTISAQCEWNTTTILSFSGVCPGVAKSILSEFLSDWAQRCER